MKLAIYAGSVADGTLQGTLRYCNDLEVKRLVIPLDPISYGHLLPAYKDKGYLDTEDLMPVQQQIEDAGLSCSVMQLWPFVAVGAPDTEVRLGNLGRSMEAMGRCGVDTLVYFVGLDRSLGQQDEQARWELLVDHYRKLIAYAEASGVKVALHSGGNLWTAQGLDRLLRELPSAYSGVCLCTGNSWRFDGEGLYDLIRRLGDKVFHVHLRGVKIVPGEERERWTWFGSGDPDLAQVVKALRDIDYRGDLHAEHLPDVVEEKREEIRTAFAIGYMRAVLQSA